MTSKQDYIDGVNSYFDGDYTVTNGTVIPNVQDIQLGKYGREMELAMLFIDIGQSTKIVDGIRRKTAAKMYKSFLWGVTKIARVNNGDVRSFNGDGVLIAFSGEQKRTSAVKAAMHMVWFMNNILEPKMKAVFQNNQGLNDFLFTFGIGIDVGKVLIVRGGIKGENNNDLVWVGNATNYAVKLAALCEEGYHIYISKDVHNEMLKSTKISTDGRDMWEPRTWNKMGGVIIYRSKFQWGL